MKLDSYIYTNKGGRSYNEDSAALKEENGKGIFVVADGLGGHNYGELASKCVVDSLIEGWDFSGEKGIGEALEEQIVQANQKLLALQEEKQSKMKSTVVVLALDKDCAAWAHVGDSRLYYIRKSSIQHITEDHSVAYKKYKAGEITKDDIAYDEDQACLLRALGGEERFEPEIYLYDGMPETGDAFFMCSDGAWEYLQEEEIVIDLLKSGSAKEWVELLLLRIFARIGQNNDNLTLLAVIVS